MSDPGNATSDLQALERFIVDNDDLLALEARIGRFNIFDALRIDGAQIRYSNCAIGHASTRSAHPWCWS